MLSIRKGRFVSAAQECTWTSELLKSAKSVKKMAVAERLLCPEFLIQQLDLELQQVASSGDQAANAERKDRKQLLQVFLICIARVRGTYH